MPAPRKAVPSYLLHSRSGRARAVWTASNGQRHDRLLPGPFDSKESRAAYTRLLLEIEADPIDDRQGMEKPGISVNELLEVHLHFANRHYRLPDGTASSEVREFKASVKLVREHYGLTPAKEFGPLKLKAVRQAMISAGWCRSLINKRVDRIKRVFKWAASEELVPVTVYESLRALAGLRRGRTDARESSPVLPVDSAVVGATLPFLNRHLQTMVELQRLTGMRPGEVCSMRLADVDRSGDVWEYRPAHHKTLHHGKDRVVMIGPKGQAVLLAFLAGGLVESAGALFSPRRAREERYAAMREKRKTPVQPSQMNRRAAAPKRLPALQYTPGTYAHAVQKAAEKAQVAHWHPNQLRHTYASEIRKEYGLEAAQVLLGHSRADVTQVYAERNSTLAMQIAAKTG